MNINFSKKEIFELRIYLNKKSEVDKPNIYLINKLKNKIKQFFQENKEKELIKIIKYLNPSMNLSTRINQEKDLLLKNALIRDMEELSLLLIDKETNFRKNSFEYLNPLTYTSNIKLFNTLIKKDIDVNALGTYGQSVLNQALKNESDEIVKLLIKNGANVSIKGVSGQTPLHCAKSVKMINLKILNKNNHLCLFNKVDYFSIIRYTKECLIFLIQKKVII